MREIKFRAWDKELMYEVAGWHQTVAYAEWYGPGNIYENPELI